MCFSCAHALQGARWVVLPPASVVVVCCVHINEGDALATFQGRRTHTHAVIQSGSGVCWQAAVRWLSQVSGVAQLAPVSLCDPRDAHPGVTGAALFFILIEPPLSQTMGTVVFRGASRRFSVTANNTTSRHDHSACRLKRHTPGWEGMLDSAQCAAVRWPW